MDVSDVCTPRHFREPAVRAEFVRRSARGPWKIHTRASPWKLQTRALGTLAVEEVVHFADDDWCDYVFRHSYPWTTWSEKTPWMTMAVAFSLAVAIISTVYG